MIKFSAAKPRCLTGGTDRLQGLGSSLAMFIVLLLAFVLTPLWAGDEVTVEDEGQDRFFRDMPADLRDIFDPLGIWAPDGMDGAGTEQIGDRLLWPTRIRPFIYDVTFDGSVPTVFFEVADQSGSGVVDVDSMNVGVSVVKLMPGTDGKTPHWKAYIYGSDQGVPQAGSSNQGTLVNLGGGRYSFTLGRGLDEFADITFEPELTHRFGIDLRNVEVAGRSIPNSRSGDSWLDIQPSTGATEGIPSRRIAAQENCASCHAADLQFHGGPRRTMEYCVTCHIDSDRDAGTGNSIGMTVMMHKIHMGPNLIEPYSIQNNRTGQFSDYSNVTYPQDVRNCTTCHDPANPETPEADWVNNRGTAEQCASCHDNLTFNDWGLTNINRNHAAGAQPNSTCAACHSEAGFMESVLEAHTIPTQAGARKFKYNILEITNTQPGDSPVVVFSITDPTNDDEPYDMTTHPAFSGSATGLGISFVWPNADFTNVANDEGSDITGRPVAQPRRIVVASANNSNLPAGVIDNLDGTYTLDTALLNPPVVIPSTTPPLGSGSVLMEGRLSADFNAPAGVFGDQQPVTSALVPFAITDASPIPRRQIVSLEKCQDCHSVNDGLNFHGNNRSDNNEACASCHNPNSTDLFRRPVDPDGIADGLNEAAIDLLEEASVNWAYMIHAIHTPGKRENPYVAYGFGSNPHDYSDVTYPRREGDCLACHLEGTYEVPLLDRLGTTVNTGATVVGSGFGGANAYAPDLATARNPQTDNNISPEAAACVACHDSGIAIEHMTVRGTSAISFGNSFLRNPDPFGDPDTQERLNTAAPENCAICHGPGAFADVAVAHGLDTVGRVNNPLDYTGKDYVGTENCLSCHVGMEKDFMQTVHPNKAGDESTIVPEAIATWNAEMLHPFGNPVQFDADEPTGIAGTRAMVLADGTDLPAVSGVYVVQEAERQFRADFYNAAEQLVHSMPANIFHVGAGSYRQAFAVNLGDGYGTRLLKYQYSLDDFQHQFTWRDRNQSRIYEVNCIGCHVVGFDLEKWEADKNLHINETTASLGVGCESCHGPGSKHVANPWADNLIVNPTRHLTTDQQTHVCSQCHIRGTSVDADGHPTGRQDQLYFKPGDSAVELFVTMPLAIGEGTARVATDGKARASRQQFMDHYIGNKSWMTCTDCHSWHNNNAEGQLFVDNIANVCASCHGDEYGTVEDIRALINGRTGWTGNDAGWWMNHTYRNDEQGRVIGFPPDEMPTDNKWPWEREGFKFDWQ